MNQIYFRQAFAVLEKADIIRVADEVTFNFSFFEQEQDGEHRAGIQFVWDDSEFYEFSVFVPMTEFVEINGNQIIFVDEDGERLVLNLFVKLPLDISQALNQ